ncbi:GatB/YqeY domain-containing protein [Annulohypoxylon maeteangense]|uniref:GatB/YqeY domain-containing protein n=1 Tax=Annulohypoxylon maeteangense TaxID=1927788 RepID=UPI002008AF0A|nr:GatB/YqeY domain-containing protein [Annulohypoxylon maeteangense]KAI0888827.1 GatB/YqeY domain-containing protein [Annulohypoxylon maeteangense]
MAALRPSPRLASRILSRTRIASPSVSPLPIARIQRCNSARFYSSEEPPPPPLLQKLKGDLKAAMRAKDAPRLSAIRSILSSVLNASKTASPIRTDIQLVALLRKTIRASADASADFTSAGREDLASKEAAQIAVLEEYIAQSGVRTLSPDALVGVVAGAVEAAGGEKATFGAVMKSLFAPGGPLDGADVDKSQMAELIKKSLAK